MRLRGRAGFRHFFDPHLAGLHRRDARIRDPLDVAVAHLAFEQALGIADAVETESTEVAETAETTEAPAAEEK